VKAAAPARVDLAGGTLDIWPLYLLVPGAVTVNLAIDRLARAEVSPRPDRRIVLQSIDSGETAEALGPDGEWSSRALPLLRAIVRHIGPQRGLTLVTRSGVPPGSGLGGSSALAVAALHALSLFLGVRRPREELLPLARDIEAAVIGVPTGLQDHYAAAFGGLSVLHLGPGEPKRERIPSGTDVIARRAVLALVGASRLSARTNWAMLRAAVDGDREVVQGFREIAAAARAVRDALLGGSIDRAAEAMAREYAARRRLVPGVETAGMRRVHDAALGAGALAGKVCGAGAGGGMLFLVPPRGKAAVGRAVAAAGARVLPLRPDLEGLRP
jgi:D-glycero-alpha-D-manno-heptose-7-phosphate kinase